MRTELALVMPVYNEEECIVDVLEGWAREFERLGLNFHVFVLNDGSRDGTAAQLKHFAGDARFTCVDKPNEGHGPTILRGYRLAVESASWVFQCDSDDEMKPQYFERLWSLRDGHQAVFGYRHGRSQDPVRRILTWGSRAVIGLLFGTRVRDVNCPYRLMRASALSPLLGDIPGDTFAPNLLVAGAFSRSGVPLAEAPIPHEQRRTGKVSLVKLGILKAGVRSFWQTLRYRLNSPAPGRLEDVERLPAR